MIARSTQAALLLGLSVVVTGLAVPQLVQAHGREASGYDYRHVDYDDDDRGESPRHGHRHSHGWYRQQRDYYVPRYYPNVVIYPREVPRTYYYAPVETVYPREYGSIGIHLDYNYPY